VPKQTDTIKTAGSQSLKDFETVVQQKEGIFGPLKALASEGSFNLITYEIGESPEKAPVLATYTGGTPPAKPDHALICFGACLVESKPTNVAAYRPS
jgi:hypothetical protein